MFRLFLLLGYIMNLGKRSYGFALFFRSHMFRFKWFPHRLKKILARKMGTKFQTLCEFSFVSLECLHLNVNIYVKIFILKYFKRRNFKTKNLGPKILRKKCFLFQATLISRLLPIESISFGADACRVRIRNFQKNSFHNKSNLNFTNGCSIQTNHQPKF